MNLLYSKFQMDRVSHIGLENEHQDVLTIRMLIYALLDRY